VTPQPQPPAQPGADAGEATDGENSERLHRVPFARQAPIAQEHMEVSIPTRICIESCVRRRHHQPRLRRLQEECHLLGGHSATAARRSVEAGLFQIITFQRRHDHAEAAAKSKRA
jgi:hypothetical protein